MTLILIAVALCALAFVAWEAARITRNRNVSARRRVRMARGSARQKAWDMVFGRRRHKRLSFDPSERAED